MEFLMKEHYEELLKLVKKLEDNRTESDYAFNLYMQAELITANFAYKFEKEIFNV